MESKTAKDREFFNFYTPLSIYYQSDEQSLSHYISMKGILLIEKICLSSNILFPWNKFNIPLLYKKLRYFVG